MVKLVDTARCLRVAHLVGAKCVCWFASSPQSQSFLEGITRRTVIDIAKSKSIKVHERKISPNELSDFEGCFLTGTAAEVTPVSQIDKNNYKVCETILELSSSYDSLVRKRKAA